MARLMIEMMLSAFFGCVAMEMVAAEGDASFRLDSKMSASSGPLLLKKRDGEASGDIVTDAGAHRMLGERNSSENGNITYTAQYRCNAFEAQYNITSPPSLPTKKYASKLRGYPAPTVFTTTNPNIALSIDTCQYFCDLRSGIFSTYNFVLLSKNVPSETCGCYSFWENDLTDLQLTLLNGTVVTRLNETMVNGRVEACVGI